MVTKNRNKCHGNRRLIFMLFLGLTFTIAPFILLFFNPVLTLINFRLQLANGTLLHEVMLQEIEGPKLYFSLFNITNADRFMSGDDGVLKVEEVGPFVYQEYRTFEDLEFYAESKTMQFTPKIRVELIVEESIGKPEDFFLVLPNVGLMAVVHILNKYPYFIGQIFKVLISGMNLKALSRISAYNYMWNNTEPLIAAINSVVPGLIYYNSTALLSRFYDVDARYRLTMDTSDLNKFQVNTVEKFPNGIKMSSGTMFQNIQYFNNSYEGGAFPSEITPETPINIYRYSICKTLQMRYNGTKQMKYGSKAFVYYFNDNVFNERKLCDTKKWCPRGIKDLSMCFNGFPLAISKGHFLDAEPKMFEKVEGLKPNRRLHDSKLVVDPAVGVAVEAFASLQLNLALGDMSLLKESKSLSDMFIPVSQTVLKAPRMREETKSILHLMYTTGPYVVISGQVLSVLLGVIILTYCVRMHWHRSDGTVRSTTLPVSRALLLN